MKSTCGILCWILLSIGIVAEAQDTLPPISTLTPRPTDTDILQAAVHGQAALLRDLLQRGGNPSAVATNGMSALAFALASKSSETVGVLVKAGADVHWKDPGGRGILGYAVSGNDVESLRLLVAAGVDPKAAEINHGTLLHLAATQDRPDVIRALLDDGVDPNQRDDYGVSALDVAAGDGRLESARVLLERGAWPYPIDTFGDTAVTAAKKNIKDPAQAAAVVTLLVSHGAPADGKNRPIDDAYLDAVHRGDLIQVKAALAHGADVNARRRFSMELPVSEAGSLAAPHPDVLAYLIDHGLNIHACSSYGFNAMHTAAGRGGSVQSIELLAKHGLDVNLKSKNGVTPLAMAVNLNQPSAVKALLALGADATSRGIAGGNLLELARKGDRSALIAPMLESAGAKLDPPGTPKPCEVAGASTPPCSFPTFINLGNVARVEAEIEHGADINVRDPAGRSLLSLALSLPRSKSETAVQSEEFLARVVREKQKFAHYLLDRGIDVTSADNTGITALHLAATDPRLAEFIEPLIKKGAKPNASGGANQLTPLLIAAEAKNQAAAEQLLKEGADPNIPMLKGITPLLAASLGSDTAMAALLLHKGAKTDVVAESGNTPLKAAVQNGQRDMVALLLGAGANPDFDGGSAPTPRAMSQGKDAPIRALFEPVKP